MPNYGTIEERLGMFERWGEAARGVTPDMPRECLEGQMSTKTRRIWSSLEETYIGRMIRRDWESSDTPVSMKCDIIKLAIMIERNFERWESDVADSKWHRYTARDRNQMERWPHEYRCRFQDSEGNQCARTAEWMPNGTMSRNVDAFEHPYYRCTRHMPMGETPESLASSDWSERHSADVRSRRFALSGTEALEWDDWARSLDLTRPRRRDNNSPRPINAPLYKKPGRKKVRRAHA